MGGRELTVSRQKPGQAPQKFSFIEHLLGTGYSIKYFRNTLSLTLNQVNSRPYRSRHLQKRKLRLRVVK